MSYPRTAGLLMLTTLLAACGDGTGNTSMIGSNDSSMINGGITLRHDKVTLHTKGTPDAVINAAGDLSIDQHPVTISPAQRVLLQDYYRNALAVQQHGIATGKAGAAIAGQAIKSVAKGLASGNTDDIDKEVNAKASLVEQEALKICHDLVGIKTAQDNLAGQLAAFKPYAGIVNDQVRGEGPCQWQQQRD